MQEEITSGKDAGRFYSILFRYFYGTFLLDISFRYVKLQTERTEIMYVKEISLRDFRNYQQLNLEFHNKVNLILGQNAQGKTNLLEAIYMASMGKSFRTSKDSEMISFGKDFARIEVHAVKETADTQVELILSKESKKSAKVDGVRIKKASELLDNIYMVIFSPEDLKIVKEEPEKRRKFIDRELCQLRPRYYDHLFHYKKILMQRNAYLKETAIDPGVLDIWDTQLSRYGASLMKMREEFIKKINVISRNIHNSITNKKESLEILYNPNIKISDCLADEPLETYFYQQLKKSFSQDIRQRTTTRGPHKDDLEFYVNEINVRNFGSQGQQRTTALSLKLAELNLIREETGEEAILLLDDVMSELDLERQEFLVKSLSSVQLFITTTELPFGLTEKFPENKTFFVTKGEIEEKK